jgi:hypothetical protein
VQQRSSKRRIGDSNGWAKWLQQCVAARRATNAAFGRPSVSTPEKLVSNYYNSAKLRINCGKGKIMRASEVFTPKGEPSVTYVNDHLVGKARRLLQDLSAGPCVVSLSGPSKSGKTVFIEKTLGRDNLIKVNGAGVTSAEVLWVKVLSVIGSPIKQVDTKAKNFAATLNGKIEGSIPLLAKGEVGSSGSWGTSDTVAAEAATDYINLLVKELGGTNYIIFIDDFHYIARDVQQEIAKQIKEGIEGGVQFVCAAVPYRSDDVLLANSDLRGRAYKVDFEYWNVAELAKIAYAGFEALNINVSSAIIDAFSREAAGSPQLMQTLCLNLCFDTDNEQRSNDAVAIGADLELIARVCRRTTSNNDYSSTVAAMKQGPKVRGKDRNAYVLRETHAAEDVYPLILRAVASDPPQLTWKVNALLARVQSLCLGDQPGSGSVSGSCGHVASIANASESRQVIEWDGDRDVFYIRDPYLLFFLRWGNWR